MKKLLFVPVLTLLLSCQNEPDDSTMLIENQQATLNVTSETDLVSIDEVNFIINNYASPSSRSNPTSISTIKSADGSPLIYCVNFSENNGFMLLSGTKKFNPILAFSDKGHFGTTLGNSSVQAWLDDISSQIQDHRKLPMDSVAENLQAWDRLLFKSTSKVIAQNTTKSRAEGDVSSEEYIQLSQMIQAKRVELESQGYRTYSITEDILHDTQWCEYIQQRAAEAIYPLYDHLWENLSFVVEIDNSALYEYSTNLLTKWAQKGGFNMSFPNDYSVGCGPLAVGQIMYFHKYPSQFDWENMHQFVPTSATSDMLYDVAKKCKANFGIEQTKVDIKNVLSAFREYGYNARLINHSYATVEDNIKVGHPVLMRSTFDEEGHEWVAVKSRRSVDNHTYVYMTFTGRKTIDEFDRRQEHSELRYLYYLWGWNGQYDGYYYDPDTYNPQNGDKATNRKDIVDIYPL